MSIEMQGYTHTFEVNGESLPGLRNTKDSRVLIPYTIEPSVMIGDIIKQKVGANFIELKVIDIDFQKRGTMGIGTRHPHLMALTTENLTADAHRTPVQSAIHIGSISGQQVQVGNNNTQITNITLAEVVKKVSEQGDPSTKGLLKLLLDNATVSAIVGAGASAALAALLK